MLKRSNKILLITEISIFAVVTFLMLFAIAWIQSAIPVKETFKTVFPFLLIAYFFIFVIFRILNFYYLQLLHQKNIIEKLNGSFMDLRSKIKMDDLLKQSLESLMSFCSCPLGILLVVDERVKKYASGEVITININTLSGNEGNKETADNNHRMLTFFPTNIPVSIDKRIRELMKEYDFEGCRTIVTIPFVGGGQVKTVAIVGVTSMSGKEVKKTFNDIKSIIDIFIRKIDMEIENSILHEEVNKASITDPLTQLYNRRYFNKRVKEKFVKAKRMGFPVSIMISDLDNFKNYVDTYGHPKGDVILSEVASLISGTIRESDMVCRFGGDEFAYLLPFASSVEANTLAERIKKVVSHHVFLENNVEQSVHLTLSMGIASFPEHGQSEHDILSKADSALFSSKNDGKNRITIYKEKEG